VVALGGGLQQQGGERLGHRGGWLAEADEDLPVGGAGDVVDGQADDAGGWLGEQQHQAGGHAGAQGRSWSVSSWPSSSSRRCWVSGATRRTGSGGSVRLGRWPARVAQRRNARRHRRWWSLWVACQASRSAWVAWARVWSRCWSQPRNRWAWVNWSLANWRWLGVRGRASAGARSRGSWSQPANWRSSPRGGLWPR